MKVIILAGGGGTRLFPLSRTCFPKQFLKVGSEKTLLSQTIKRFLKIVKAEDIIIISNENYFHHIKNDNRFAKNKKYHAHKTQKQISSISFPGSTDNIPDVLAAKNQVHGKTENDHQK